MIRSLLVVAAAAAVGLALAGRGGVDGGSDGKRAARSGRLRDRFPVTGTLATSAGPMNVPFHLDEAEQTIVAGTFPAAVARDMLKGAHADALYEPLLDGAGRAIGQLWAQLYYQTTAGAYEEFVFNVLVRRKGGPEPAIPALDTPEAYATLLTSPGVTALIERLFLNETEPIVYGREIFSLNKRVEPMKSAFALADDGSLTAEATHAGEHLVSLSLSPRPGLFAALRSAANTVSALGGIGAAVSAAAAETIAVGMVAPGGLVEGQGTAPKHIISVLSGSPVIQAWDPAVDRLSFGPAFGADLGNFEPVVVTRISDGQFVMWPAYDLAHAGAGKARKTD